MDRRAIAVIAAAGLLGSGAGGVALLLTAPGKDPAGVSASEVVAQADRVFAATLSRGEQLHQLVDLPSLAVDASRSVAELRTVERRLTEVTNRDQAAAARAQVTAELRVAEVLADLGDLVDRSRPTVRSADELNSALVDGAQALEAAAGAVLSVTAAATSSTVGASETSNADRVRSIGGQLRQMITTAARKLGRWQQRIVAIRRSRKARVAVLDSYASSLRSYVSRYSKLRDDMEEWISKVDAGDQTYSEAFTFLDGAASQRASIRAGMKTLDAPSAVASAHNHLIDVIDLAITAVNNAYTGLSEYQYDYDNQYSTYKDTPGWLSFKSASNRVASQYDGAVADWGRRMKRSRSAVLNAGLPSRPSI
jgi:hypothetical protein